MPRSRRRLTYYASPGKRRNRSIFRRRTAARRIQRYWRRRRRYGRRARAIRAGLVLGGFPAKRLVRLRYGTYLTLGGVAGTAAHGFRLNSVYDPDIAAGGHQPRFYDQWTALYQRYTVVGSKISLTWVPHTTEEITDNPARFGIYIPQDANDTDLPPFGSNPSTLIENKRIKPLKLCGGSAKAPRGRMGTVTKKFGAKKYFGVSDLIKNGGIVVTTAPYSAAIGANPANVAAAICFVVGTDGSTLTGAFNFQVQIDYLVLFDDLIEPSAS